MDLSNNKPKILLTNSLTTGLRFVKKINLSGVNLMNYNIYTPSMLVKEKIIKLRPGIRLISDDESAYILLLLIQDNNYGLKEYVTSFGAASKLLEVINDYRYQENNGFANLIDAQYISLMKDYEENLNNKGLIDYIDALSLLLDQKQSEECYILDDLELRPLEEKVFRSMFDSYDNQKRLEEKPFHVSAVYKNYGQYNEVLSLIEHIENYNKNKEEKDQIKTGDIEVLYTDSTYENIIKGICSGKNIPYTLKGNHAKSTNFISFVCDVLNYYKNDYKYELLRGVLSNQGLPSEYLKQFDKTSYFPKYVVGFSKERSLEFIRTYEVDYPKDSLKFKDFLVFFKRILEVTDDGLNYDALIRLADDYLCSKKELEALSNQVMNLKPLVELESDFEKRIDLIINLLKNLTYNDGDNNDKISFSKVNNSFTLRKLVFVLGCNQTFLLGNDIENAFIKDVDAYKSELGNDKNIHISEYQRTSLIDNLKHYLSRSDAEVVLSYSCFDKVNMKEMTDGVRLISDTSVDHIDKNLYYAQEGRAQFINSLTPKDGEVKNNFDNGVVNTIESTKPIEAKEDISSPITPIIEPKGLFRLSPTDVYNLVDCPFRYYYQKIFNIPDIRFPTLDESTWLEANTRGTMFHETMELYFNQFLNFPITSFDENAFENVFSKALNEAIAANPINNDYIQKKEAEELKEEAKGYLQAIISKDTFQKYFVLKCEYNLSDLNLVYSKIINGKAAKFLFTGIVDRVDGYVDKSILHLRVVDYKTGEHKSKTENKYYQHILYSYILEKQLPKNEFGLKYDEVVVDQFVYSFPLDENKELVYSHNEIDQNSKDYSIVFNAIEGVLVPYLTNETNLINKIDDVYKKKYPHVKQDTKYQNGKGVCEYCTYKKICIKRIEWGAKHGAK